MTNEENIFNEPIEAVVKEILQAKKNRIILMGTIGSGKTLVLNELLKLNKTKKTIIMTSFDNSLRSIPDAKCFDLYYISLMLNNILDYIKLNYPNSYGHFSQIHQKVTNIIAICSNYEENKDLINNYNPRVLIMTLKFLMFHYLKINNITLVIDDFDSIKFISRFQRMVIDKVSPYFNLIMSVSDHAVLNNQDIQKSLAHKNTLIKVNYNFNVDIIREILYYQLGIYINSHVLLDNLIKITNGNITEMINIIKRMPNLNDKLNIKVDNNKTLQRKLYIRK